jgi:hypothetical protein
VAGVAGDPWLGLQETHYVAGDVERTHLLCSPLEANPVPGSTARARIGHVHERDRNHRFGCTLTVCLVRCSDTSLPRSCVYGPASDAFMNETATIASAAR